MTSRVDTKLADMLSVGRDANLELGLSLLSRFKATRPVEKYVAPPKDRVMVRFQITSEAEALLDRLPAELNLTKQQVVDLSLHLAKASPLSREATADTPSTHPDLGASTPVSHGLEPVSDNGRDRDPGIGGASRIDGASIELVAPTDADVMPFYVTSEPELYREYETIAPSEAERLFYRAPDERVTMHRSLVAAALASDLTTAEEAELLTATLEILTRRLRGLAHAKTDSYVGDR